MVIRGKIFYSTLYAMLVEYQIQSVCVSVCVSLQRFLSINSVSESNELDKLDFSKIYVSSKHEMYKSKASQM